MLLTVLIEYYTHRVCTAMDIKKTAKEATKNAVLNVKKLSELAEKK
jgi:hypothetical protein